MTFHLGFLTFLAGGSLVAFSAVDCVLSQILFTVGVIPALVTLTLFLDHRIRHENRVYQRLGKDIVKFWEQHGFFNESALYETGSVLHDEAKNFGTGTGYKETLRISWATTVIVSLCVFAGSVFL